MYSPSYHSSDALGMLAAHVHRTPDILTVIVLCRKEDLDSGRVIGVWVSEVFCKGEDPFDISAVRNIPEQKTRACADPKSTLIASHRACSYITDIPIHRYASHKVTRPMVIAR